MTFRKSQPARTAVSGRGAFEKATGLLLLSTLMLVGGCGSSDTTPPPALSVLARSVTGSYTQPDSVTVDSNDHIFVGFGDGNAPDGSDGKSNTIVEYTLQGKIVQTFTVPGHNDGLRINPADNTLWAMQNEDSNPSLAIINPATKAQTVFTFAANPTAHGGGYDDIVFAGGKVFFSASNPANNPNNQQAIVQATLSGTTVNVTPVINGNDAAVNRLGGASVALNLQDPDSMTVDPAGDLVLDSQADNELVFVLNPGSPSQSLQLLPLTTIDGNGNSVPVSIDDTVFVTSPSGTLVITDQKGDTIFLLQATNFTVGSAFSAATGALLQLSTASGLEVPVITTPTVQPKGLAFIPL